MSLCELVSLPTSRLLLPRTSRRAMSRGISTKPAIVIVGTGWSSFSLLSAIDPRRFDVTVISPRNHMLFTPLLASTAVGTLEFRSIAEPLKHSYPMVRYIAAECTAVDHIGKFVAATATLTPEKNEGEPAVQKEIKVGYDVLVLGCGARNQTFGIAGVQKHMYFLKELADARAIRKRVLGNIEAACIPGISPEERQRLLSIVICGGGPTGVEFAAELHDMMVQDLMKLYPGVIAEMTVTIVEGKQILGSFDASLREFAEKKFRRDRIAIRTGSNVVRVEKDKLHLSDGSVLNYGLGVWNTGIGPRELIQSLSPAVFSKDRWGHVITDSTLRCQHALPQQPQAPGGSKTAAAAAALGDHCASGAKALGDHCASVAGTAGAKAAAVLPGVWAMGDCASVAGYQYAATAQVAEQQGLYVAQRLNACAAAAAASLGPSATEQAVAELAVALSCAPSLPGASPGRHGGDFAPAPLFKYHHGGSLAYVGSFSAISDFTAATKIAPLHGTKLKGWLSWLIWRSAYLTKLGSWRNRVQVPADWARTLFFGRDTTVF